MVSYLFTFRATRGSSHGHADTGQSCVFYRKSTPWTTTDKLSQNLAKDKKGTLKQIDITNEIQIWKDVCFWLFSPILLSHATKKLNTFFSTVCRAESLQQTKFVYVAKKLPKVSTMLTLWHFWAHFGTFWEFCVFFCIYKDIFRHLKKSWSTLGRITNFVCRSDSVRQTIMKKISNLFDECNKETGRKKKKR